MGTLQGLLGAPVALEELKHKPGKRGTFRAVGSRSSAIVKMYASDRATRVAARVDALSHGPSEPRLPQVLLVSPTLGMVVVSEVPGTPLRTAVLQGEIAACRRTGAALGRWHGFWRGQAPAALAPHTIERELTVLRRKTESAPTPIASRVRSSLPSLAEKWSISTVVHRDLYEEQILVADRIGLIDLDDAALGPPELDVGNLWAHLELLALRFGKDLWVLKQALLHGYATAGRLLDPFLLDRCRRLALLRLACIHRSEELLERATTRSALLPSNTS